MIPSALIIAYLMMKISLLVSLMVGLLAVYDTAFGTALHLMNINGMLLSFNCVSCILFFFHLLFRMMKEKSLSLRWF